MSRRGKLLVVAVAFVAAWAAIAPSLATRLIVSKELDHADAILVLSGSAVYKERTRKAAELCRDGVATTVIISDDGTRAGWFSGEQNNPRYVDLEVRELTANGVPNDAIVVLPGSVAGTDDEARAVIHAIDERGIRQLLIVTSGYHTRRALWTFEKILAGRPVEIGIVGVSPGDQTPGPQYWWITPRGWQTVAAEYVKMAVYYFYY